MSSAFKAIPAGYESESEDSLDLMLSTLNIKRLEDITTGACLNGSDFDAKLEPHAQEFFETFRCNWNMQNKTKSPHLRQNLQAMLLRHDEPLLLALKIFANCPDSSNVKNKSLSYFVLETVCKLHLQTPQLNENCNDNTSMVAFNFVKITGLWSLNNAVINTYRLREISHLLMPKLHELLDKGHYKDVTQWAINLQITDRFDIMDLAFPLIAQEKLPLAEEYLDKTPHQRLPFVKFLDSLLHKDKSVIELCEHILIRYKNLKISHNVISYRPISKIVIRLAKKYNFDDSITPNCKFTKTCGYLHHLYREFEKGSMGVDAFRELIVENAYNHELQKDFVDYVAAAHGYNEAVYWYKHFKLEPSDCPYEIKSMISNDSSVIETSEDCHNDMAAGCDVYLSMDLPDECLVIVDSAKTFESMLCNLEREHIIYMDAEWKQNVCVQNQLCLLQIATGHNVYLIDCLRDNQTTVQAKHWGALGAKIFNNSKILKVGFSMNLDLKTMQASLPMQLRLQSPHHYLDLRTLWMDLKKLRPSIDLPYGNINRSRDALSDLTLLCLGKQINKSNQCSNWANRPLRREQILYAAIDVRCLVLIYNTLEAFVPNLGITIDKSISKNNFLKRGSNAK